MDKRKAPKKGTAKDSGEPPIAPPGAPGAVGLLILGVFASLDRHATAVAVCVIFLTPLVFCIRCPADALPRVVEVVTRPGLAWSVATLALLGLILAVVGATIQRKVHRKRIEEMAERISSLERQLLGTKRPSSRLEK